MAIISFADDSVENFFYDGIIPLRAGWARSSHQVLTKLDRLHMAARLLDMSFPPGNNLHRLEGSMNEYYSVRINKQWRLIFKWKDGNASAVNIVDYH